MCYYHLMNRVAGEAGYFPCGDVEKEKLCQLSVQVARFYSLDLLSFVCMGNHWHAVCAAPAEPPASGGEDSETIFAEEDAARSTHDHFTVTVRRRVRYWPDGAVIGSELFVREVAGGPFNAKRARRKRLAKGIPPNSAGTPPLFADRRLGPTL